MKVSIYYLYILSIPSLHFISKVTTLVEMLNLFLWYNYCLLPFLSFSNNSLLQSLVTLQRSIFLITDLNLWTFEVSVVWAHYKFCSNRHTQCLLLSCKSLSSEKIYFISVIWLFHKCQYLFFLKYIYHWISV